MEKKLESEAQKTRKYPMRRQGRPIGPVLDLLIDNEQIEHAVVRDSSHCIA